MKCSLKLLLAARNEQQNNQLTNYLNLYLPLLTHINHIYHTSFIPSSFFLLFARFSIFLPLDAACFSSIPFLLLSPFKTRTLCPHTTTTNTPAVGVDPSHHPLAGKPPAREHHAGHAAEAGGLPRLPPPPQAAQSAGEVPAGDQLQHPADQAEAQQQARLHALGGKDGLGKSRQLVKRTNSHTRISKFLKKSLKSVASQFVITTLKHSSLLLTGH